MKHIFLNLKRFDIPKEYGGVNTITKMKDWGPYIIKSTQEELKQYGSDQVEFGMFFPEAHLIGAVGALSPDSPITVGSQGVYREDTVAGGNFGAFTTNRSASAVKAMGCTSTIIGHCEERKDINGILAFGGVSSADTVSKILNMEMKAAVAAGLRVLYCIGEASEEQLRWKEVLDRQLSVGLEGVDKSMVTIAYEPVWAIGPGRNPPDQDYITMIGTFIKDITRGMDVVYGGGLKTDNAGMLASVPVMDGGLIALTRFQGEIGFYPDEYLEIIRAYLGKHQTL